MIYCGVINYNSRERFNQFLQLILIIHFYAQFSRKMLLGSTIFAPLAI